MLKINAIGNVTNDPELRQNESTGKTYCIIRIACDRRYRDRDGNKLTDCYYSQPIFSLAILFRNPAYFAE